MIFHSYLNQCQAAAVGKILNLHDIDLNLNCE
jgi:hypothetical protein